MLPTMKLFNILIVEDQRDLRELFKLLFKTSQYSIHLAATGDKAFELLSQQNIDMILLDVMLGIDDGRVICKKIKDNPTTEHIKIVLMSASYTMLQGWQQHGADDCLEKPFDIKSLFNKLHTLIPA